MATPWLRFSLAERDDPSTRAGLVTLSPAPCPQAAIGAVETREPPRCSSAGLGARVYADDEEGTIVLRAQVASNEWVECPVIEMPFQGVRFARVQRTSLRGGGGLVAVEWAFESRGNRGGTSLQVASIFHLDAAGGDAARKVIQTPLGN